MVNQWLTQYQGLTRTIDSQTNTGEHIGEQTGVNSDFSQLFPVLAGEIPMLTDAKCRNAICSPDKKRARFTDSGGPVSGDKPGRIETLVLENLL